MYREVPTDEPKPERRASSPMCQSRELSGLESMLYTSYIYALQVASLCRLCVTTADKEDSAVHIYSVLIPSLYFQLQWSKLSW